MQAQDEWIRKNQECLMTQVRDIKRRLSSYIQSQSGTKQQDETVGNGFSASQETVPEKIYPPTAIDNIARKLGLTSFEKDILLCCAAAELDAGFTALIGSLTGINGVALPSFSLLLALLPNPHWDAISLARPLRYWRLIELDKAELLTQSSLRINEHVLQYLTGVTQLPERFADIADPVFTSGQLVDSQRQQANQIVDHCFEKNGAGQLPLFYLSGNDSPDKLAIAANVSEQMNLHLFSVSATSIGNNAAEATVLSRIWSRESILSDYALFIDCDELDEADKASMDAVKSFVKQARGLLFFNTDHFPTDFKNRALIVNIEKPKPAEQLHLWQTASGGKCEFRYLQNLVSHFTLSADTILRAGREAFTINGVDPQAEGYETYLQAKLWKICCRHTRPRLEELAQRITPVAHWDDIILPEEQKNTMREIAMQVRQRSKVYDQWGFAAKGVRGLGISALFAGESGTGKTMASEVLARELNLDLYKIDLSKVVNKYIGETEKNLKKIFDAAEDGGAILLFDEADALFGKRSDVKDSHDRHSNIEVSYLLQRIESFRGLAILTTNMKSVLDKAFMRRIRFSVQFPFPDTAQRAQIWLKIFPDTAPKNNLDANKLAKLNLPGGSIRNIALNAAFFAANDDTAICMHHISKAAKAEYDKLEKPLTQLEIKGWQ